MCEIEEEIFLSEKIARYLFQKGHFTPSTGRVKYGAFMPDSEIETSVSRTDNLSCNEIWEIGKNVAGKRVPTLKGRVDLIAWDVYDARLEVVPDPKEENPRHANIVGWPKLKDEQILRATKLADSVRFTPIPAGSSE